MAQQGETQSIDYTGNWRALLGLAPGQEVPGMPGWRVIDPVDMSGGNPQGTIMYDPGGQESNPIGNYVGDQGSFGGGLLGRLADAASPVFQGAVPLTLAAMGGMAGASALGYGGSGAIDLSGGIGNAPELGLQNSGFMPVSADTYPAAAYSPEAAAASESAPYVSTTPISSGGLTGPGTGAAGAAPWYSGAPGVAAGGAATGLVSSVGSGPATSGLSSLTAPGISVDPNAAGAALGGGGGLSSGLLNAGISGAATGAVNSVSGSGGTNGSGGGSGTNPTAAATGGALSRIVNGDPNNPATTADWLSVLGTGATTALGIYGANQQASSLADLNKQYLNYGAPSRARYEASMTPGFDPTSIPGYSGAVSNASDAILRKLSVSGNPYGSPGALIEANKSIINGTAMPAIQNYQNQNANTGGIGALTAAAPGAATGAINANQTIYGDLGYGINQVTNPAAGQNLSLAELMKKYQSNGLGSGLSYAA